MVRDQALKKYSGRTKRAGGYAYPKRNSCRRPGRAGNGCGSRAWGCRRELVIALRTGLALRSLLTMNWSEKQPCHRGHAPVPSSICYLTSTSPPWTPSCIPSCTPTYTLFQVGKVVVDAQIEPRSAASLAYTQREAPSAA